MNFIIISFLWYIITPILSSVVIDESVQKQQQQGINYNDYCPKSQYCPDGAHVMCTYFVPHQEAGPKCVGYRKIDLTPQLAQGMLDLINEIRGRVSQGIEVGKDKKMLPRAYGLFKLNWDEELATFAQILANTCVFRKDYCRSTKKFSRPGQAVSMVRFRTKDWGALNKPDWFHGDNDLSAQKIEYATKEAFKSSYQNKDSVTPDMLRDAITNFDPAKDAAAAKYLQLVDGQTTHMGCGLSAHLDYLHKNSTHYINPEVNVIHIVCNFSSEPKKGTVIYKTENPYPLPFNPHYSKCGCPEETDEDDRCLCVYNPTHHKNEIDTTSCDGKDESCKPTVVLLPIFTVDDAPKDVLRRRGPDESINVAQFSSQLLNNEWIHNKTLDHVLSLSKPITLGNLQNQNQHKSIFAEQLKSGMDPKEETSNFHVQSLGASYGINKIPHQPPQYGNAIGSLMHSETRNNQLHRFDAPRRAGSLFSNPGFAINKLPAIKMDVAPRKDFTKAQQLVNEYLNQNHVPNFPLSNRKPIVRPRFTEANQPKPYQNNFNNITLSHNHDANRFVKSKFHYQEFDHNGGAAKSLDVKNLNEEFDNRLMTLLDSLEQAVGHIELGDNEKQIFDAKIRKIYGTAVGKPPKSLISHIDKVDKTNSFAKTEIEMNDNVLLDALEDPNKRLIDQEMYDTEDKVRELNSEEQDLYLNKKEDNPRFLPRDQNSLVAYEEMDADHYDFRNTFNDVDQSKHRFTNKKGLEDDGFKNIKYHRRPKSNRFVESNDIKSHPLLKAVSKHRDSKDRFPFESHGEKHENLRPRFSHKSNEIDHDRDFRYNKNRFHSRDKYSSNHEYGKARHASIEKGTIDDLKRDIFDYDERQEEDERQKNFYLDHGNAKQNHDYDYNNARELLSNDRKKFYQQKLDSLERKYNQEHERENFRSKHNAVRTRRLMRGRDFRQYMQRRPSRPDTPHYYIPDRVQFANRY